MTVEFKKINERESYIMRNDRPIGTATIRDGRIFHVTCHHPTEDKLRAIADKLEELEREVGK